MHSGHHNPRQQPSFFALCRVFSSSTGSCATDKAKRKRGAFVAQIVGFFLSSLHLRRGHAEENGHFAGKHGHPAPVVMQRMHKGYLTKADAGSEPRTASRLHCFMSYTI